MILVTILACLNELKDKHDDVKVEIDIENEYYNYLSKENLFTKTELLGLSCRIKNNYFYKYTEESISFINPNFKILLWGKEEEQYMEIQLYIKGTSNYYNLSLSTNEMREFVKLIDLQTKS